MIYRDFEITAQKISGDNSIFFVFPLGLLIIKLLKCVNIKNKSVISIIMVLVAERLYTGSEYEE